MFILFLYFMLLMLEKLFQFLNTRKAMELGNLCFFLQTLQKTKFRKQDEKDFPQFLFKFEFNAENRGDVNDVSD